MADGDDLASSTESAGLSEEIFTDPEASDVDRNTPSVTRTSAARRLFTGERTGNPLGDRSNCSTLTEEANVELSSAVGKGGDDSRPVQHTPTEDTQLLILQEVKQANSRLNIFSNRLEALESRLASVENNQLSLTPASTSTDSSADSRRKRKVPAKVRHEVREVYKALLEDDENFLGFDTKKRFTEAGNQDVVKKLTTEVTTLDPKISHIQVRDAARRFFQSKSEEEALKDKGKYVRKVTLQRRRNRLLRKLESRKAVLLKTSSLKDAQRDLWMKVVIKEFISSEESGEEDIGNGEKRQVMLVKPLPWRAAKVHRFFTQLDHKVQKNKSKQSKQQTLPRVVGEYSTRPKPAGFSEDFFGFTAA